MSKIKISGIFKKLLGTVTKKPDWEIFEHNVLKGITSTKNKTEIKTLIEEYKSIILDEEFQDKLQKLADLEYVILQKRCTLSEKIVLGVLKNERFGAQANYLIARAPFPHKDKKRDEMRVYLGRMDELNFKTVQDAYDDENFMSYARKTVKDEMLKILAENVNTYVESNV
jgi:hypothetical protein